MSWLETELREQPAALARLLERQGPHVAELAEAFHREDIRYVLIASRGTSSNAARYAQYVLGRAHRVPVMFATPSLYTIYGQPPRLDGGLVIGISQSGASPDVVSVLLEARRQGRPTIAMTNDPDSPLAMAAAAVLPLEAGEERAVAATKTYLNSLGAIALLFTALGDDAVARDELSRMPELLERQIALSFESAPPIEEYGAAIGATVVARGVNYGTAFEIALKIRELSGLLVEAYSPADLMHGPIAAIQPNWPVILVAPTGPARPSVEEIVEPLRERGARVIAVSDAASVLESAHTKLPLVPDVPEWLSPLTAVIPGQVTAMRLAAQRGLDVDHPAGPAEDHAHALTFRSRTRSCVGLPCAPSGSSSTSVNPCANVSRRYGSGWYALQRFVPATSAQRTTSSPRSKRSRSSGARRGRYDSPCVVTSRWPPGRSTRRSSSRHASCRSAVRCVNTDSA